MRRKAWRVGFGIVVAGIALFAVLVPKRRTPFQEGYGLRFTDETTQDRRGYASTRRTYASDDPFDATESLIGRKIGRGPDTAMRGSSLWVVPEGIVSITDGSTVIADETWPRGARCVVSTHQPRLGLIERLCVFLGIKP